jgi:hypothetical protein
MGAKQDDLVGLEPLRDLGDEATNDLHRYIRSAIESRRRGYGFSSACAHQGIVVRPAFDMRDAPRKTRPLTRIGSSNRVNTRSIDIPRRPLCDCFADGRS